MATLSDPIKRLTPSMLCLVMPSRRRVEEGPTNSHSLLILVEHVVVVGISFSPQRTLLMGRKRGLEGKRQHFGDPKRATQGKNTVFHMKQDFMNEKCWAWHHQIEPSYGPIDVTHALHLVCDVTAGSNDSRIGNEYVYLSDIKMTRNNKKQKQKWGTTKSL